ncbi:hypothetical protein [Candidatus Nitronereus thalassa]|uniref:Lipoprotein n=1 Tax=Candidatus Nitronereus thalassa TaxID=3020898 RepID=A0ABU3K2W9_9BACT|nr:hypothetical protein [Candidatus Nitronereus thalassa]MDT7040733.1 hypothetical protein [Candidatus Nitronereus thalassa]
MKRASIGFGLMFILSMTVLTGCASSHPKELVERNDHAGLKTWYLVEAATLRGKAEEMRQMAAEYRTHQTQSNPTSELAQHCENLVERYTKAAEDAETLANVHAKHPVSGPGNTQPPEAFKLFSF